MKAKFTTECQNGKNYGGDKELISAYSVIGTVKGQPHELVVCRCYMGRSSSASVVYASLWVHVVGFYTAGHGSAGGYGYHKKSAAIQDAISSAGIELLGSPYADSKGMHYKDFPNPDFDAAELSRLEAAEDWEGYKSYKWSTPETIRKLVKDTAKTLCHIGGCGDGAVESALIAIAKAAGARGRITLVSH